MQVFDKNSSISEDFKLEIKTLRKKIIQKVLPAFQFRGIFIKKSMLNDYMDILIEDINNN